MVAFELHPTVSAITFCQRSYRSAIFMLGRSCIELSKEPVLEAAQLGADPRAIWGAFCPTVSGEHVLSTHSTPSSPPGISSSCIAGLGLFQIIRKPLRRAGDERFEMVRDDRKIASPNLRLN